MVDMMSLKIFKEGSDRSLINQECGGQVSVRG